MSKTLTKIEIEDYYNKLYEIPSFIETLNTYEKNEVYQFAEKELINAIDFIDKTLLRSNYNYPEPYKDKHYEYWTEAGHYENYKKPKIVIDRLTAKPKLKPEPEPKLERILTLKSNLSNYQAMIMISDLKGFLFSENTDSLLLFEFFTKEDISNLNGRIDLKHSTRLFAYFFVQLYMRKLIDNGEYQNIIDKSSLFYSKKGNLINANNLSTAINHINEFENLKDSEKIDSLLDQFKPKV